jgi:hypothetical protein
MTNSIKLKIYSNSVINSGSGDAIRKYLGGYWRLYNSADAPPLSPDARTADDYSSVAEFLDPSRPDSDSLPGGLSVEGKVITDIYTDSFYTSSSPSMLFPSIKGVVRLVGNSDVFNDDYAWEEWVTTNLASGIYTDCTTELNVPYNKMFIKALDPNRLENYAFCSFNYDYNYHLPEYQKYTSKLTDERQIPNFYHVLKESTDPDSYSGSDPFELNKLFYLTISGTTSLENIFSVVSSRYPPEHPIDQSAISPTGEEVYSNKYTNIKNYLTGALISGEVTLDNRTLYSTINQNLFINRECQANLLLNSIDKINLMPYCINLKIPIKLNEPGTLCSMLNTSGFENNLLAYVKNTFVDNRRVLKPKTMQTTYTMLSSSVVNSSIEQFLLTPVQQWPQTNLLEAPLKSLLDRQKNVTQNFDFVATPEVNKIINNPSDSYRFSHTIPALRFVKSLNDFLTSTGFGFDALVGSEDGLTNNEFDFFDFLKDGKEIKHNEVLLYRLEKKKVFGAYGTLNRNTAQPDGQEPVQNFYFTNTLELLNSADNRDGFIYRDTQVKYGQSYNYTLYAYVVTLGYDYAYKDIVYSQQISSLDLSEVSDGADTHTAYCLQFKNITNQSTYIRA